MELPIKIGEAEIVDSGRVDGAGPTAIRILLLVLCGVARVGAGIGEDTGLRAGASVIDIAPRNAIALAQVVIYFGHVKIGRRRHHIVRAEIVRTGGIVGRTVGQRIE